MFRLIFGFLQAFWSGQICRTRGISAVLQLRALAQFTAHPQTRASPFMQVESNHSLTALVFTGKRVRTASPWRARVRTRVCSRGFCIKALNTACEQKMLCVSYSFINTCNLLCPSFSSAEPQNCSTKHRLMVCIYDVSTAARGKKKEKQKFSL